MQLVVAPKMRVALCFFFRLNLVKWLVLWPLSLSVNLLRR